jgi:eukaryotic-like serine/threonine-protein kinase
MSTVYAARDLRFSQVERICAIKEMFDLDPDSNVRALRLVNFEREAALLATISHPAVPKIYDFFSANGLVYLVLEFIEGQDLERMLDKRKSPFPEDDLRRWAMEICSVLETIHSHKPDPIIFRDLKPSNIMLRNTGQIVLVDFGIARTIQGRQRGTMIGTEGYAPPEQYRGLADPRGDIYALGATLHHLGTKNDPRHETPFTFQERTMKAINPDLSDGFASIVMKMVSYNPVDRYQSVESLVADLEAIGAKPVKSAPPPATAILPSPTYDVVIDEAPAIDPSVPHPHEAPLRERVAERKGAPKRRASRRRRTDVYEPGERLVWAVQTGDEVRGSAVFDGRSFFIGSYDQSVYSLSPVDGSVRWRFRTGRGVVSRPAVNERAVFFGSEDHTVYAVGVDSGVVIWMPIRSSPTLAGDRLFIGSDDGTIYCLAAGDGKSIWKHRAWGPVRSSAVVQDAIVIIGSDDGYLHALRASDGRLLWRASCGGPIHSTPCLSGDLVYVTSRTGQVNAFQRRTGERCWHYDTRSAVIASPRVAGDTIVCGSADGSMFGLGAADGGHRWTARFANQITSTTLVAGDVAYVGTIDGDCVCFRTVDGDMVWKYSVGGSIVSSPVYGGGVLLVGSNDGRICGLALTDTEIERFEKLGEGGARDGDPSHDPRAKRGDDSVRDR